MEYIGAMRVPPSRTYLFTGEKRKRIGASGENAASLIVMDAARSGRRKRKLKELTSEWLLVADKKISSQDILFYYVQASEVGKKLVFPRETRRSKTAIANTLQRVRFGDTYGTEE